MLRLLLMMVLVMMMLMVQIVLVEMIWRMNEKSVQIILKG